MLQCQAVNAKRAKKVSIEACECTSAQCIGLLTMPTPLLNIPRENYDRVLELACQGKPSKQLIDAMGCSRTQFYKILQNNPSFERELTQARRYGYECLAEGVLAITEDDPFGDPQILRLKSDNTKWFLGVCEPAKYGMRQTVTVESVDLGSALTEARNRANKVIDITPAMQLVEGPDPFE